jgi:hypothetical protein
MGANEILVFAVIATWIYRILSVITVVLKILRITRNIEWYIFK